MSQSGNSAQIMPTRWDLTPGPRGRSAFIEPDLKVGFVLTPFFTLLPFAGFLDTLRHAADEADRSRQIYAHWSVIGATLDPVVSSCGVAIAPWEVFGDPRDFDYIVVVGGLVHGHEKQHLAALEYLNAAHASGVDLVSLCTGSFALAESGLLDGRRCAVHFRHKEEFEALYPKVEVVSDEAFLADDNIITCPGGTAAIDLAVELIARHAGYARASKGLPDLLVEQEGGAGRIPVKPREPALYCNDNRVEQAIKIMQSHLARPKTTLELASAVGLSGPQFNRIFLQHMECVPQDYYRLLRLKHARWRLLNSKRSLTEIANECGFSDSAHLVRRFKSEFGTTPGKFRLAARQGQVHARQTHKDRVNGS